MASDRAEATLPRRLVAGADNLEVLVEENMVRPVDAYVVDLVVAVAQFYDSIDDAARIGGQRGFGCFICHRSGGDSALPLGVVRRDLADGLCRA